MNITGTSTLAADRATVWRALNDPAVLVAAIPGCRRLEALGGDSYKMTVEAGVGSIKGVYDGEVHLTDHEEPSVFRMLARGAGAPGTIGAEVLVRLDEHPAGGTLLSYDADATVGGMIGGVGQRMLTGVSRRMADEFFRNVEAVLAGAAVGFAAGAAPAAGFPAAGFAGEAGAPKPSGASRLPPDPSTVAPAPAVQPAPWSTGAAASAVQPAPAATVGAPVPAGTVFTAPTAAATAAATTAGTSRAGFALGVAAGAAAALAGAVVGAWIAGRRTR